MKKKIIVSVVILIATVLGAMAMYYPSAKDVGSQGFSCQRVKEDLKVIAKEPHATNLHPQALKKVREYIVEELTDLNMNPQVFHYDNVKNDKGAVMSLDNIYAKMDGVKGEEGNYLLLVAHYDSARSNPQNTGGYSYGAADDGYGVASILETLRLIKEKGQPLVNGIKVLITDGEEQHLIGSKEEMDKNYALYKNVSYVINLEARGTSGQVLMFQVSENNSRVLDLFKKANYPITNSFITEVYKDSGRSDFLNLQKKGLPGINLSLLDQVEYYHTPEDSYANISERSIAHYGEQIVPIVEEYTYSEKYADGNYFRDGKDMIFFTLLPNVLVRYSMPVGMVLATLSILGALFILVVNGRRMKEILKEVAKALLWILTSGIVGFGISYGLALLTGHHFTLSHMGKVPGDDILVVLLPLMLIVGSILFDRKRSKRTEERLLCGVLLQCVLAIITMLCMPGASYLVILPFAILLISMGLDKCRLTKIAGYIRLLSMAAILILYIPLMIILIMAFSIVSLPFLFIIAMLAKVFIVPLVETARI